MKIFSLKFIFSIFIIFLLCSCGGGGGSSSGSSPQITYDYSSGVQSSFTNATSNLLFGSSSVLPYTHIDSTNYASLNAANNSLNSGSYPIASTDTNASTAWAENWTGLGVKIGIADSFNSNNQIDIHGDYVALIANSVAPESNLSLANILGSGGCGGISLSQTLINMNNANDAFEASGHHIVNNSWGIERVLRNCDGTYSSTLSQSVWDSLVNQEVTALINSNATPLDQNMLFIYAAGNSAQQCPGATLEQCNLFAAIVDGARDRGASGGHRMMWVGAIEDDSTNLTNYSIKAGDLKYDYIVAHDDVLIKGDAAGTSFSAPRVAGAAALLRHKFPNLDAAALKQILLQTATDLGSTGVDSTYGYGLLNIPNAMSPQGKVVPK